MNSYVYSKEKCSLIAVTQLGWRKPDKHLCLGCHMSKLTTALLLIGLTAAFFVSDWDTVESVRHPSTLGFAGLVGVALSLVVLRLAVDDDGE